MTAKPNNAGLVSTLKSWARGLSEIAGYIRRTRTMAVLYFNSEEKVQARLRLIAMIVTAGAQIGLLAQLSYMTADVFDALDSREFDDIWVLLTSWLTVALLNVVAYVAEMHFRYYLIIDWRRFLTRRLLDGYFDQKTFNQLELKDYNLDNPDQRIAMDIEVFVRESLELGMRFLTDTSRGIVFSVILWRVSGDLPIVIGDHHIIIPGYMFWVTLIYAIGSTWLVHKVCKPIIGVNFRRQTVEADFRYHMVRVRENTESIALIEGEKRERRSLNERFSAIRSNWLELLKYQRRLIAVNFGLGQISDFVPYVVAMPALLLGNIAIGGFIQLRGAFNSVERALMFFAQTYGSIAAWKASVDRVMLLEDAMTAARNDKKESGFSWGSTSNGNFEIRDLTIELPTDQILLENADLDLKHGENIVITGVSGSGKSTLFRALSDQWVWGGGSLKKPCGKIMFLPQKAYFPIGTLRAALTYPNLESDTCDEELETALRMCALGDLIDKLDEHRDWGRVLSGGEQQRLSFARILLQKPDWLFMDEATSALDGTTETMVYSALQRELPDMTIVSIAHRDSLRKFHNVELRMEPARKSFVRHPIAASGVA